MNNAMTFSFRFFFIFLLTFVYSQTLLKAQCKASEIVSKGKIGISEPYLYDGFTMTQFSMDNKEKVMKVEFAALKQQKYKLYFRTSDFDEALNISIYDNNKKTENDTVLNVNTQKDKTIGFEITKSGTYTVEYKIPVCENSEYGNVKNECILMLISYKEK
jgi:hypothetical protein